MLRLLRSLTPSFLRPHRIIDQVVRKTGLAVIAGPFRGMQYVDTPVGSALGPKLIGVYERELHEVLESICAMPPSRVVNVGAAEGYYAIGLLMRLPQARLVAFEEVPRARELILELAQKNAVSARLDVRGRCEPADLASLAEEWGEEAGLMVCDVEGYEQELLNPVVIPGLARWKILVEVHDCFIPGLADVLVERFEATHNLERIWATSRTLSEYPWRSFWSVLWPSKVVRYGLDEGRPGGMSWLWMDPKNR